MEAVRVSLGWFDLIYLAGGALVVGGVLGVFQAFK